MNPSLLLIPDRYKASKLYSQIPDSGAGDLAFTRANDTATRVNSEGLIEKVRTNLVLQSEDFSNAAWEKDGATVTANDTTAPNGTLTADKIVFSDASKTIRQALNLGNAIANRSVFVKGTAGETISIDDIFVTAAIITLTGDWQRVNFTAVAPNGYGIGISTFGGATARTIWLWGAQAELGDIATPYIPTTTAAVSVGMLANIPRIDYTGGGCGKLLLEPQRTNLALFSEQFNNAAWSPTRATITANQIISPDGFTNADLITDTTFTNNQNFTEQSIAVSNANVTYSIFVKKGSADFVSFGFFDNAFHGFVVNTTTWASTHTFGSASSFQAVNYGNGWYRLSMNKTASTNFIFTSVAVQQNSTGANYNGTSSLSAYFWGAQMEAGAYPTSYIPTLGASVTRSADAASKTGISSLIGQTQGSIYAEFVAVKNSAFSDIASLGTNATTLVELQFNGGTNILSGVYFAGTPQASIPSISALTIGQTYKVAFAYKDNDFVMYLDGVQQGTDTSGTVVAGMSEISLNGYGSAVNNAENALIKAVAVYPTRLSNAELASLTSL